ncbi:MAG: M3 family oligoendopeptidase [Clostridia bacterium]|nr:M3 family oligoendopeptidase [Clostridia bacterium]
MKFSEMKYISPSEEEFGRAAEALTEALSSAATFEEADRAFRGMSALCSAFDTAYSLCMVRHEINTLDKYYDEENEKNDEILPLIEEKRQAFYRILATGKFRDSFNRKYGELLIKNIEIDMRTFSPEIIPDLQEENRLVNEYTKLLASAQIEFDGKKNTIPQMMAEKQRPDDKMRRLAWEADGKFYSENGERLDSIYHQLVQLRASMAKKLGFDSYIGLGYARMGRNCYTPEDIARFREAVIKYVVPLADSLYRDQAKRLGVPYPLSFADASLSFRSGNPAPKGTPEEILAHAKKMYHEMSEATGEFIDFLYDNELLDVLCRHGKGVGGFCTSFTDYRAPFIFANFNGTADDVETMTHEAGHAYAAYVARDVFPTEYRDPTLDACEIHSMSMEFFAWPWAEGFFREDTEKFKYSHLAGAIKFIPYGTMVDHFQHSVFEKPDMTPEERHGEWRRLLGIYMPWMALDDSLPFYGEGKGWQRQSHIYQRPFYYIDYCLAQTVSLEFFALMQKDREEAFRRYNHLVSFGGSKPFTDLVRDAGMDDPFGDALKEAVSAAENWLKTVNAEQF